MSLVRFTNPAGRPVCVRADAVEMVREPISGDHPRAKSVLILLSGQQAVLETIQEAEEMLQ
jgi:hypothetical protein